jgi:dihydropteroate synthase
MGIVNATPDSFSDGGEAFAPADAIARGLAQLEGGADIIDVGGESTRPGATPVSPEEEIRRILPVVSALVREGAIVSVDTRHAAVMAAALEAGARIINDVSALEGDPASLSVAAASGVDIVLMHMPGTPQTMRDHAQYADVVEDVFSYLERRIAVCAAAGIARARLAIDPGFGFGKMAADNERLLAGLGRFTELGCPILVGLSRKFGKGKPPKERLTESLEKALQAVALGANIVRVHDVAETVAAFGGKPNELA